MEREIGSVPFCFRAVTAMRRGRLTRSGYSRDSGKHTIRRVHRTRCTYLTHKLNPRVLSFAGRYLD